MYRETLSRVLIAIRQKPRADVPPKTVKNGNPGWLFQSLQTATVAQLQHKGDHNSGIYFFNRQNNAACVLPTIWSMM